tara:strand:- start:3360 stop:4130 length:771 start_codon:yes stop_codon:yes gene_type:complete
MSVNIYSIILPRVELLYLPEWIEHNISIGVNKIILYNNGYTSIDVGPVSSGTQRKLHKDERGVKWVKKPDANYNLDYTDEEIEIKLSNLTKRYAPHLEIVSWKYGIDHNHRYPPSQIKGMRHCLRNKKAAVWLFVDPDEYVVLKAYKTLQDLVTYYKGYSCFYINQRIFSSRSSSPVKQITKCYKKLINKYKTLTRAPLQKLSVHEAIPRTGSIKRFLTDDEIVINHYMGVPKTYDYIEYMPGISSLDWEDNTINE